MAEAKASQNEKKNLLKTGRPMLLVTIVDSSKADSLNDLIQTFEVNLQLSVQAQGTADPHQLDLLGLRSDPDKAVILGVVREDRADELLDAIENRFNTVRNSKGIAFTVPMSSVIGVSLFRFLVNDRERV